MEVEAVKPERRIQLKKYHVDLLSTDKELQELNEKYKDECFPVENADPEDLKRLFERYASEEKMDLYTIAETLGISDRALYYALKTDKIQEMYHAAKLKRGERIVQMGLETASIPFDKIQQGQEVSMVEVAAAKLKSNYSLMYGQALNSQFNPVKDKSSQSGGVNVVVNTGVKLEF